MNTLVSCECGQQASVSPSKLTHRSATRWRNEAKVVECPKCHNRIEVSSRPNSKLPKPKD